MRISALLLGCLMLLQGMDVSVNDLLQLDNLVQHARYHREHHGDSLWVFLAHHYGHRGIGHQHQGEEGDDHEQLPFQTSQAQVIVLDKTNYPYTGFQFTEVPDQQVCPVYHPEFYNMLLRPRIFQPPRLT